MTSAMRDDEPVWWLMRGGESERRRTQGGIASHIPCGQHVAMLLCLLIALRRLWLREPPRCENVDRIDTVSGWRTVRQADGVSSAVPGPQSG